MESSSADFMLEEYRQIANGYQDLHAQQNELVKFYLTLVAVPASLLAVVAQVPRVAAPESTAVAAELAALATPVAVPLMGALSIVGFMVVLALVTTRIEALQYVRTVNCVRRYFVEHDVEARLKRYLVLPDYDTVPGYSEGLTHRAFWNVTMVSTVNTVIFFVTVFSAISWRAPSLPIVQRAIEKVPGGPWGLSSLSALLWFGIQLVSCKVIQRNADRRYHPRFTAPFPAEWHIGIDLDGVLGDLAGAVISAAADEFGLDIKRTDITSHNLQECTALNGAQVAAIFEKGDVFRIMQPVPGASVSVKRLRATGWVVHIVTDRFWNHADWSTATRWLAQREIGWDHLNLVRADEKPAYASGHRLRFFVEDNYDTAVNLASVCERVYLLDTSYNQGSLPANIIRLSCWQDILADLTSARGR